MSVLFVDMFPNGVQQEHTRRQKSFLLLSIVISNLNISYDILKRNSDFTRDTRENAEIAGGENRLVFMFNFKEI